MLSLLTLLRLTEALVTDLTGEYATQLLDHYRISEVLYNDVTASVSVGTDYIDDETHAFVEGDVLSYIDAVLVESHSTSEGPQWRGQGVGSIAPMEWLETSIDCEEGQRYYRTLDDGAGYGFPVQDFSCDSAYTPEAGVCDKVQGSKLNLANTGNYTAFFSLSKESSCEEPAAGFWVRSRAISCISSDGFNSVSPGLTLGAPYQHNYADTLDLHIASWNEKVPWIPKELFKPEFLYPDLYAEWVLSNNSSHPEVCSSEFAPPSQ